MTTTKPSRKRKRSVDEQRLFRRVTRINGCEVRKVPLHGLSLFKLEAVSETGEVVEQVVCKVITKGMVDLLISRVYAANKATAYNLQSGKCCWCGKPLNGQGEADHKNPRARGERDDRVENLQLGHPFGVGCGGAAHRKKHGG